MQHFIRLDMMSYDGSRLHFRFSSSLDYFLKKEFYVRYSEPLTETEPSLLAIPFAALMLPVAWATGADLFMPTLDIDFMRGMDKAKLYWQQNFGWPCTGRVQTRLVHNYRPQANGTGMLFSGGLDSLSTYIKHRAEKPDLFVVLGADIPEEKMSFINQCKEKIFDGLGSSQAVGVHYIHTDIKKVLDRQKLDKFAHNWYGSVQFGVILPALVAPLSHSYLKKLIIAGCSHREDSHVPCSGDPAIVQNLHWAGTYVQDDSNEYSRTEKIARYLKPNPEFLRYLRVCWVQHEQINCGRCEKCLRTICELLLNNIDPNDANLKTTPQTLSFLKSKLQGRYNLFFRGSNSVLDFWRHIRSSIDLENLKDIHGSREFFRWLAGFDRIEQDQPAYLTKIGILWEKLTHKEEFLPHMRRLFRPRGFPYGKLRSHPDGKTSHFVLSSSK